MKKLLSLLIAILMMALPIACAEESAPAAEESAVPEEGRWLEADAEGEEDAMQIYMLQGTILEVGEDSLRIEDAEQGEVVVLISEDTVLETGYELAVGDYVYVDYNGVMTRSLPPQVTAGRIVSHKLEGDVLETYPEENAILIYTEEGGEYRVNLPETWAETGFEAQRAIVYYDGAATLSIPPQVSAGLILPVYALEDIVTELSESMMILGKDDGAVTVTFDPALLPEGLAVGDAVRVTYNDVTAGTAAEPERVVAVEIVKISA